MVRTRVAGAFLAPGLLCGLLLLCFLGGRSIAAEDPLLAIRQNGGQGRSYVLDDVHRITFGTGTVDVETPGADGRHWAWQTDRIEFVWEDWTGVPDQCAPPMPATHLQQNSPNPFTCTTIAFYLPCGGQTELAVYSVGGRLVRTILSGYAEPGEHEVLWDGRDSAGVPSASGVYFCRLSAAGIGEETRKMILLR